MIDDDVYIPVGQRADYFSHSKINLIEKWAEMKKLIDEWFLGGMSEDEWQRRKMEIVRNVK